MTYISDEDFSQYSTIINDFGADVSKDTLLWYKCIGSIPRMGSDQDITKFAEPVALNILMQYNAFRTWPITTYTEKGEEDKQSELAYLSISYLQSLELLDSDGNFAYDASKDRFKHKGILYYDSGHTPVAQAGANPLYHILILKRVDVDNQQIPL